MELLNRLNARLATLSELREIVIAMRSMAASAMREGSAARPAILRYSEAIQNGLADVAAIRGLGPADIPKTESGPRLLCLIGSEHGFVGNLNQRLIEGIGGRSRDFTLLAIGRKLAATAADAGLTVRDTIPMTGHLRSIPATARRIAEQALDFDRITIAVAARGTGGRISVEMRDVLPIPAEAFGDAAPQPPTHQLAAGELFRLIGAEYVLSELARALVEALVIENEIRLQVLTAADRNIADKIETLGREANTLRQQEITAELIDIVTGAEAVRSTSR